MDEEHGGEGRGEEMRVEGKEGRSMGKRGEDTEMKVEGMEWGRSMGRTGGGVEKGVGMWEGGKEISLKKYLYSAPRYVSMYQSFMQSARKGEPSCAYRYVRMWRSRATSCLYECYLHSNFRGLPTGSTKLTN